MILVKHSLSQVDPVIPSRQWLLSAEGVRRCLPLARRLADYHPDIILSSDEPKAIETGRIVAEQLALPWQIGQDLHEQERETAPFYPSVRISRSAVKRFFESPDQLVFGEETADEAHCRFANAVTRCAVTASPAKGWLSSPTAPCFHYSSPACLHWTPILSGNT